MNLILLNIIENIKINYINFIKNTNYAYYEIKTNNNIFHGVINIKSNIIMFNTNELINDFRPLSYNEILAIRDSSEYKICTFINVNSECLEKCAMGKLLIYD